MDSQPHDTSPRPVSASSQAATYSWPELEAKFLALHEEQLRHPGMDALHASWNPAGWKASGKNWRLDGGTDHIRNQFESLAEHAAVKLKSGLQPGRKAVFYWLDLLKRDQPDSCRSFNYEETDKKGKTTPANLIVIEFVCKASAEYCVKAATTSEYNVQPTDLDVSGGRLPIRNGERCTRLMHQIKRVRNMCLGTGRTMAEVQQTFPDWEVWKVINNLPAEDQETFAHPNRWGPVVGYGRGLLAKEYGKSSYTIRDWIKAYRQKQAKKSRE